MNVQNILEEVGRKGKERKGENGQGENERTRTGRKRKNQARIKERTATEDGGRLSPPGEGTGEVCDKKPEAADGLRFSTDREKTKGPGWIKKEVR